MPTIAAIRDELLKDPDVMRYSNNVASRNDTALANMLNDQSTGASRGYTLDRKAVSKAELQACVIGGEYLELNAAQIGLWAAILASSMDGYVDMQSDTIRQQISAVWSRAVSTSARIAAVKTRNCSRAEMVWGEGTVIPVSDVSAALNS